MAIRVKLPNGQYGQFPDDMPHEEIESILKKQFPPTGENIESELVAAPFNNQPKAETTGWKGLKDDAINSLAQAIKGGIGFVRDIPNKLEKSGQYIEEHPGSSILHYAGQLAAETANLGKGILNLPHDVIAELGRKGLVSERVKKYNELPFTHIPEGTEKALGLEADTEKGDELFRAVPDIASIVAPGISVAKVGKRVLKGPDLKTALRETQSKVNSLKNNIGSTFDVVKKEVDQRGIGKIPIKKELISQAENLLDKTPESKDLIKRAKTGDYNALRDLQSDLREIGETALSNKLSTERKIGKEALSTRKQINNSVEGYLEESGHKDLSQLLKQAKQDYAGLQNTYFSSPALAKVFGKSQKVPKNPVTLLTEESTEMNNFFKAHPEMQKMLEKTLKHKSRVKRLGKLGTIGLTAAGIEGLDKFLR